MARDLQILFRHAFVANTGEELLQSFSEFLNTSVFIKYLDFENNKNNGPDHPQDFKGFVLICNIKNNLEENFIKGDKSFILENLETEEMYWLGLNYSIYGNDYLFTTIRWGGFLDDIEIRVHGGKESPIINDYRKKFYELIQNHGSDTAFYCDDSFGVDEMVLHWKHDDESLFVHLIQKGVKVINYFEIEGLDVRSISNEPVLFVDDFRDMKAK
ncbi:MAG: hypothetical protein ACOYMA_08620 [Bacteroidia bacterium]